MVKVIDPAKLSGTLKVLAQDAAKKENNKNLIDTNYEIGLFENHAKSYLQKGVATDYTLEDLNNILGKAKKADNKKAEKKQEAETNPYKKEFAKLSSQELADKMFNQISGYSRNQKTLDMYNAIPDSKLMETVSRYNTRREEDKLKEFFFGETRNPDIYNRFYNYYDSMFYAMNNEWGMYKKDLKPCIERLIKIISSQKLDEKQKSALDYAKLLLNNAQGNKFDKETICLIENNLAIAMKDYPKYKKEGLFGSTLFERWTMDYSEQDTFNEVLGF